jgi:hypothetical protein
MKSTIITILLLTVSILSFGQAKELTDDDYNSSGAIKLIFETEISRAQELAKKDIEKGISFLLIQSGIAPVVYTTNSVFENRFKAYYYEQGCTGPDYELMKAYNIEIFKFLDKEYGKEWRRSIRKDVIGFKKWKRKN